MRGVRLAAWAVLATVFLVALFPDFCSPYPPVRQYRDLPYAPPGRYHGASIHWLVHGEPYRWLALQTRQSYSARLFSRNHLFPRFL